MADYAGYVKDLKTGAIIGISKKSLLDEIERNNQKLIKQRKTHLIEHDVLVPKVLQKFEEVEKPKLKIGKIKK